MTSGRKRHNGAYARARRRRRIAGGLAVIWMSFVLFLDFRYALFPKTTIGGLEILGAAVVFYVAVRFVGYLTARLWRFVTGGKDKRRAFAPSAHTPS